MLGLADVEAARDILAGTAVRTPVVESRWLSDLTGQQVHLKCENLQRTGSFKLRGAFVRIARLSARERAAGVVAASAGNHAQGVALAAQQLGIPATVFMPEGAPIPKERATRAYGAEVVFAGRYFDDALREALAYADRTGATFIHPFDHPDVVVGQGTVGLEMLDQVPDAATILVPAGGGGLVAGVALAVKAVRPGVRVVAVQAEGASAIAPSLDAGAPVRLDSMSTMADGIAVGRPGEVPLALIREHVDDVVSVSEESLSQALLSLVERAKMVVEPAGAAAVAALVDRPDAYQGPVVALLSGGNIDPLLLGKVIRHGLASAGRFLNLAVSLPDVPGALNGLLTEIAASQANIRTIGHDRTSSSLRLDEVEVRIECETRGTEHAEALIARLRDLGYKVL
ncbi:threonine ammonia-lyase [Nocardioides sp. WY-20]|uniref:L-threonine dehydratase catabolic TdcB n=1 Tax=Nocardioides jiangxiensis TaxID=3064524 RepID=A0ABT9B5F5_9ACTN|nr:threonine ammonia-lyase [Nocardioides sp. WY-20]MDO7868832.1 threonine ammonia-lyase [Nocardioides sp. WY-20]